MKKLLAFILTISLNTLTGPVLAEPSAAELMKQGDAHWEANQPEQAMESYLAAEKADPTSVELLMKKAGLQMTTLHYSDAVASYQKAIGLDPKNAKAFIGMGVCYLHSGATTLAKAAFEEAIKIEPERHAQLKPAMDKIEESLQREAMRQMEDAHAKDTGAHGQTNPHSGGQTPAGQSQ